MGFLKPEHEDLKRITREFTNKEVVPIADALDREEAEIPASLLQKMAEMGFFGMLVPKEYGGLGLDGLSLAVVTEELSRGWLSVGSVAARNVLCGHILFRGGTEEQKRRLLPRMALGDIQTASAGTEPEAGSDAANIKTTARKVDDRYVVNGSKMFCTFANQAHVLFAYVRTSSAAKQRGISLLLIEKPPGEQFAPPHLTGTRIRTVGYHGMHTYALFFDGCEVPERNLVGGVEGQGFKQLMLGYEIARIQFAFRCIGLAQAAYEAALTYSKQRVQFGQPIATFQAVRFKLADMAAEIEAARQLGYLAAEKFDRGERCDLEAGMAKLFAAEMAHRHCWNAVQIHGGYGYTREYSVNRYWRDSGLLPIGEGTSEIQREVIARRILQER
jgi:alkylation response protein AidB-like acyl-CoA dehydrogenase